MMGFSLALNVALLYLSADWSSLDLAMMHMSQQKEVFFSDCSKERALPH